ncbi:MAG: hypothetical protein WCW84_06800 [Sulfurimonas sp.]|jgi:hypothetical protein
MFVSRKKSDALIQNAKKSVTLNLQHVELQAKKNIHILSNIIIKLIELDGGAMISHPKVPTVLKLAKLLKTASKVDYVSVDGGETLQWTSEDQIKIIRILSEYIQGDKITKDDIRWVKGLIQKCLITNKRIGCAVPPECRQEPIKESVDETRVA